MFKINATEVKDLLKDLDKMPSVVMKESYKTLKNATPTRGGNARNKTKLEGKTTIGSRYPYADRLDKGWSKQAPKGFTSPTIDKMEQEVNSYIDRID